MSSAGYRLLWTAPFVPYPPISGHCSKLFYLLREVSRRHEVDLLCFVDEEPRENIAPLRSVCRSLDYRIVSRPLSWPSRIRGILSPLPLIIRSYLLAGIQPLISQRLQRRSYDLVHVEGYFLGACLAGLSTPPRLIAPHDAFWRLYLEQLRRVAWPLKPFLAWELYKVHRHEPAVYRSFDACVFCTDVDARSLSGREAGINTVVVSNGVELTEQEPRPALEDHPSLVFSGSYLYPPNETAAWELVVRIAPPLRRRWPGLKVYIVGNRPSARLVEAGRRDARNVISGRVEVMADWIARGSVYCSPLRRGAGFKNKVPEAWAMERPLVATPKTMEGIEFTPGREALVAETTRELVRACALLLENRQLRRRMGAAGRRLVEERYNWPRLARTLLKTYDELVAD
ncbi:MAG: glycosyltransferase [Candidatus Coatesbacteria bacterium]|nr:glycosyltransferase [Candidatus Coatesbacteria bacterium]